MAIQISDISISTILSTTTDSASYTTSSATLDPDNVYFLVFAGETLTGTDPSLARGVPTQSGVTWEKISEPTQSPEIAMNIYKAAVSSQQIATISLDYANSQTRCYAFIVEVSGASATLVQSATGSSSATNVPGVTLPSAVTTGNLCLSFFYSRFLTDFTVGANETALLTASNVRIFAQYNLSNDNVLTCSTSNWENKVWAGIEIVEAAAATVAITSVNSGATIADGDAGVTIAVTDGVVSGYTVTISPTDNISDSGAVVHTTGNGKITSESTTEVDITVDLPTGSTSEDPVFVFVNDGTNTTAGFSVNVTPAIEASLFTLFLTDDGLDTGTPVVCESTDFTFGLTIDVYRVATPTVKETATEVTAISGENTATPQFNALLENGDLVTDDEIKYSYSGGDIKAATGGQPLGPFTDKVGTNCA